MAFKPYYAFLCAKKRRFDECSGFKSTKGLKETMSSMYLSYAKYDRMYRQCMNNFGGALLDDPFNKVHSECNNILGALNTCIRNNQWFHETKKVPS